jgi:hypothetical protein
MEQAVLADCIKIVPVYSGSGAGTAFVEIVK